MATVLEPVCVWLVGEGVCYPATGRDVECASRLLSRPYAERMWYAEQLEAFVGSRSGAGGVDKGAVNCRGPEGWRHLVGYRFAKWLVRALRSGDVERVRGELILREGVVRVG
jgi:hypothetical protein